MLNKDSLPRHRCERNEILQVHLNNDHERTRNAFETANIKLHEVAAAYEVWTEQECHIGIFVRNIKFAQRNCYFADVEITDAAQTVNATDNILYIVSAVAA